MDDMCCLKPFVVPHFCPVTRYLRSQNINLITAQYHSTHIYINIYPLSKLWETLQYCLIAGGMWFYLGRVVCWPGEQAGHCARRVRVHWRKKSQPGTHCRLILTGISYWKRFDSFWTLNKPSRNLPMKVIMSRPVTVVAYSCCIAVRGFSWVAVSCTKINFSISFWGTL